MPDRASQSKAFFWGLFLTFLLFATVPSWILLDTLQQYVHFVSGWDPGTLRTHRSRIIPHRVNLSESHELPDVHFVEFKLRAPDAKDVTLAGDFNGWHPEKLPLVRAGKGNWNILVPLPPGKYKFLFKVDGKWVADPQAKETAPYGDQTASVVTVAGGANEKR